MSYSERTKEAVMHLYTIACVDLHNRFKDGKDHTKEMALCNALEGSYPEIIAAMQSETT